MGTMLFGLWGKKRISSTPGSSNCAEPSGDMLVSIKIPRSVLGQSPSCKVTILGEGVCWRGRLNHRAVFSIGHPVRVRIRFGGGIAWDTYGTVSPGCDYQLLFHKLHRGKPVFTLSESW